MTTFRVLLATALSASLVHAVILESPGANNIVLQNKTPTVYYGALKSNIADTTLSFRSRQRRRISEVRRDCVELSLDSFARPTLQQRIGYHAENFVAALSDRMHLFQYVRGYDLVSFAAVSNAVLALHFIVAWYNFCSMTGLSPLYSGQWNDFVASFADTVIQNAEMLAALKVGFATTLSGPVRRFIDFSQLRLKTPRLITILVAMAVTNASAAVVMVLGISGATALAGVPLLS